MCLIFNFFLFLFGPASSVFALLAWCCTQPISHGKLSYIYNMVDVIPHQASALGGKKCCFTKNQNEKRMSNDESKTKTVDFVIAQLHQVWPCFFLLFATKQATTRALQSGNVRVGDPTWIISSSWVTNLG